MYFVTCSFERTEIFYIYRLIHYNAKTKTNKVLMDGLHFANGVILSPGEDFLIVAETGDSRLHRYYLKGPKKGTHDIFLDGLPGLPDNLNSDGRDGFFVPLVFGRDADHPIISQIFGPFPLVRKLFSRIIALTELGFKTLHKIYPTVYSQTAIHWVSSNNFLYCQIILLEQYVLKFYHYQIKISVQN